MMKKLAILPVATLVAALVAAPVAAAGTDSPEQQGNIVSVTQNGTDITADVVIDDLSYPEIAQNVAEMEENLSDVNVGPDQYQIWNLPDDSGTIESELNDALDQIGSSLSAQELTHGEIHDISYVPNGQYQEIDGEIVVTLYLDDLGEDEFVIVIHNSDTDMWEVLDPSKVTINADGSVTFTTDSMSPFLFVYGDKGSINPTATPTATATPTPTSAPKSGDSTSSPQTGESAGVYLLIIAGALTVAGVVCVKRSLTSAVK